MQSSDGPYAWSQTGRPDPGLVRLAGDFDRGTCPVVTHVRFQITVTGG